MGRGIRESVGGLWGSVTDVVRRVILSEIVRSFRVPPSLLQDYHLVHQQGVAQVGGLDLRTAEGRPVFLDDSAGCSDFSFYGSRYYTDQFCAR